MQTVLLRTLFVQHSQSVYTIDQHTRSSYLLTTYTSMGLGTNWVMILKLTVMLTSSVAVSQCLKMEEQLQWECNYTLQS